MTYNLFLGPRPLINSGWPLRVTPGVTNNTLGHADSYTNDILKSKIEPKVIQIAVSPWGCPEGTILVIDGPMKKREKTLWGLKSREIKN